MPTNGSPSPATPWPPPGRVVGLDLGEQRIGIARSDSARTLALPHDVLVRSGDPALDRRRLAAIVDELGATLVIVGVPIALDGRHGPAAAAVLQEVDTLRQLLEVPLDTVDERLSTAEVLHRRREHLDRRQPSERGGRPRQARRSSGPGRQRSSERRPVVDHLAATVLLQAWLDAHRPERGGPERGGPE